jgi:ATP-dependent Clp protease protease subunit
MQKAIALLDEVKESIINAYQKKTGMSRGKLSQLMDAETWMNAKKAIEYGFADGMLERETPADDQDEAEAYAFSRRAVTNCLLGKLGPLIPKPAAVPEQPKVHADQLLRRLYQLKEQIGGFTR